MMKMIKVYLIAFTLFFSIDMVWLGVIAKQEYQTQIGHLMSEQICWQAALLFYVLYVYGILFFALLPALATKKISQALLRGALFGLICYATYDLTNLATLHNWPVKIVVYDLLWGAFLTVITSAITFWTTQKLHLFSKP